MTSLGNTGLFSELKSKVLHKPLMAIRFIAIGAAIGLIGCTETPQPEGYFPLNKGLKWTYRVVTTTPEQQFQRLFTIENLGAVKLKGYEDDPVYARLTSDGTRYLLLQDDTGTYRVATQNLIEYKPRIQDSPTKLLPNTPDTELERSWSLPTQTYAVHMASAAAGNDIGALPLTMEYEITSLDDTVTTPAGQFEQAVRVEGKAFTALYADPSMGYQDVQITQTEWYVKGVGLVKLVRNEPLDLTFYKGGQIVFELISLGE